MKRPFKIIGIAAAVAIVVLCGLAGYQTYLYNRTIIIDPNLKIVLDNAGNSVVLTADSGVGVLLVDTKEGKSAEKLQQRFTDADLWIVNTHSHPDHASGNSLYPKSRIIGGDYSREQWEREAKGGRYPDQTLRPKEELVIEIGTERVHIRNVGRAHTSNDVVVYLEKRKVLIVGDLIFPGIHPVLFASSGGNIDSWTANLQRIAPMYPAKIVIPGHGQPTTLQAVRDMMDYFTLIQKAVDCPQELKRVERKYRKYYSVPNLSSFEKTVAFVKKERSAERRNGQSQ